MPSGAHFIARHNGRSVEVCSSPEWNLKAFLSRNHEVLLDKLGHIHTKGFHTLQKFTRSSQCADVGCTRFAWSALQTLREPRFDFVASKAKSILLLSFISHSLIQSWRYKYSLHCCREWFISGCHPFRTPFQIHVFSAPHAGKEETAVGGCGRRVYMEQGRRQCGLYMKVCVQKKLASPCNHVLQLNGHTMMMHLTK